MAGTVVVALDASSQSVAALEAAADLAAWLGTELAGLFVEDVGLLRLAASPAATEILYLSAQAQPLDLARMERILRAQAEQARQALARVAERAGVPWTFRVVRGEVSAEVLMAAAEADLLSLGRAGWSLPRRLHLGSTARAALEGARTSLLLAQCRISPDLPVAVVYDRSSGAADACRVAAWLAKTTGQPLRVFVLADSHAQESEMEAEAARLFEAEAALTRFCWLDSGDEREVLRALKAEKSGVVVLGAESPLLENHIIDKVLCETDKPVLVVGQRLAPAVLRATVGAKRGASA
ncbi:MAG TPA: universal stress protein [Candidatus Acidoferrales bacterium]|nr:universal stress protein [Candidatus Acidoferrales bacterium]